MARQWLTSSEAIANVLGYGVGILISYILNGIWTFRAPLRNLRQVALFILVITCSYIINLLTVLFSFNVLTLPYQLAHASGILPYTTMCYLGCRYLVFPESTKDITKCSTKYSHS